MPLDAGLRRQDHSYKQLCYYDQSMTTQFNYKTGYRKMGINEASRSLVFTLLTFLVLFTTPLAALQESTSDQNQESIEHILVMGDSISAAYGIETEKGWVNLLQEALSSDHPDLSITNASISGDTTDGGLQRLPRALEKFSPDLVIIELGGNDGLRGQSIKRLQNNLEQMAMLAQDSGADVLILGMRIPSNYGAAYTEKFFNAFAEASDNTGSALVPFLLEPIATSRQYFQPDGVHPTAEAQPLLMELVLSKVKEILTQN